MGIRKVYPLYCTQNIICRYTMGVYGAKISQTETILTLVFFVYHNLRHFTLRKERSRYQLYSYPSVARYDFQVLEK